MKETSKSRPYREIYGDFDAYLHGYGIDIGGGPDPLIIRNGDVDVWDLKNGDGEKLDTIKNNTYNFVYSSHCLEHLRDIDNAIKNWSRVLKNGGFLYFCVPDYECYEKKRWPSKFARRGHKYTFSLTTTREETGRNNHYNIFLDLIPILKQCQINPIEVRSELNKYNFLLGDNIDQTWVSAQAQICIIGEKKEFVETKE